MATDDGRTPEQVRRDIEAEREQLATRSSSSGTSQRSHDVTSKLRAKLPVARRAALGAGFVLAGGIGATMRLLARRSLEGTRRRASAASRSSTATDPAARLRGRPRRPARRLERTRARMGRRLQADVQGVPRRRLHGSRAADRLQLAARVLPGGRPARRPARPDRRLRRAAGFPRPGRSGGGHRRHRDAAGGHGQRRVRRGARHRRSSAPSGPRAARWARW